MQVFNSEHERRMKASLLFTTHLLMMFICLSEQRLTNGFNLHKSQPSISLFDMLVKLQQRENRENMFDSGNTARRVRSGISWEDCSKSNDLAEVLSVTFNPDPPQTGTSFKISIKTQLYKEITGGNVLVNIQYLGYIPVLKETLDLCDLAASSGDSCPLAMGVHENYLEDKFPDFALSGQYTGTIKAVDSNSDELSCVSIKFTL